jgi:hypothetical protein
VLKRTNPNEEEEEYLFFELEAIFENRVYCKEELDYNIGICYLMQGKYKQAYYYLQNYPNFLVIIKKAITIEKELNSDNEFISKERPRQKNYQEMLIDEPDEMSDVSPTKRYENKPTNPPKKGMEKPLNISNLSSLSQSFSANSNRESETDAFENITPFPTHNRLCSIYSPKVIGNCCPTQKTRSSTSPSACPRSTCRCWDSSTSRKWSRRNAIRVTNRASRAQTPRG